MDNTTEKIIIVIKNIKKLSNRRSKLFTLYGWSSMLATSIAINGNLKATDLQHIVKKDFEPLNDLEDAFLNSVS